MDPIVIIGTGLSGYNLAKNFRHLDKDTPLVLITQDDGRFYSKPLLSTALTQKKEPDKLTLFSPEKMSEQVNATIHTQTTVTEIQAANNTIFFNEEHLKYSKLVLAIGADPIDLKIPGSTEVPLYSVNDLIDYGNFRKGLKDKKKVLIIGSGLIGCEFANDLGHNDYSIDVVSLDKTLLERFAPATCGVALKNAFQALPVTWHLETTIEKLETNSESTVVLLSNGKTIETEIILSAVGLRPRIQLAESAGINVESNGIVVDRLLQTSKENIYSLGDCAQVAGFNLQFIMPLMNCAKALSQTLAGEPTEVDYPAMPIVAKTSICPILLSPPLDSTQGEWEFETEGNNVKGLFKDSDGKLLGYALTGECTKLRMELTPKLPSFF